jgi:hypothetical protein
VAVHLHSQDNSGALKSVRQSAVVRTTLTLPNGSSMTLNDAVVFDVTPAGRGLDVVIGFGGASS